jgi:hypothetical protein
MAEFYRRTQIALFILIPVDTVMVILLYLGARNQSLPFLLTAVGLGVMASLFYGLTVTGTEDTLEIRFGVGLIKRQFKLKEIVSALPYRTNFWHGWGIHYSGDGTIYNASGFDAVQITMMNGKKYIIGTNDQAGLLRYIEEHREI